MKRGRGLLIVDMQIDFCPGGALPVPHGHEIVPSLNKYIDLFFDEKYPVLASRDWHAYNSKHFDVLGGQWPVHCVQGTEGAKFYPMLHLPPNVIVLSKGMDPDEDGYSVFAAESEDGERFADILERLNVKDLFVGGLATDYCVKQTVLDALAFGFKTYLLIDATKGVNASANDVANAIKEMRDSGVEEINYDQLENMTRYRKA
ncbi:MAG: isochorismatase family protein [Candidatus Omnitrophota bacterium]